MPQWNKILWRQYFSNKLEERIYAKMILFQGCSFSWSRIPLYLNDKISPSSKVYCVDFSWNFKENSMALIRTWTSLNPGMRWPKGMFVWNWPSGNDGVFYIFSAFCSYRYMYLCYPWNERPFNEPSHLTNIVYKTLYTLTLLWHLIIMTHSTFKSHILSWWMIWAHTYKL